MKKIISAILTASLSLGCIVSAGAADRSINISEALANTNEIHIIYNDTVVAYEDVKPVNTDGRVMIPFRAALESMGATVSYDEETRTVTATKGDITITFALMDDTIYIDEGGEQSTITMDVPMIIIEDRVMVPIRFMSNALGMQVGWDGDSNTVVIADYNDYLAELAQIAPNLTALSQLDNSKLNKSNLTFDISLNSEGAADDVSLGVSGSAETVTQGVNANINAELTVDSKLISLDKATVTAVFDGSKLYVMGDAAKKLADVTKNEKLTAIAAITSKETWYAIDLDKLLPNIGIDESILSMVRVALAAENSVDIETLIKSTLTTEGDAQFNEVVALASMIDMYESLDDSIKITTKENGGYTVSLSITPEDFVNIIDKSLGSLMTAQDKAALLDVFTCSLTASTDNDVTKQTSNIDMALKSVNGEATYTLNFKVSDTSETEENIFGIAVPMESVDITDALILALNK